MLLRRRAIRHDLLEQPIPALQRVTSLSGFSFERPIGGVEGRRIETKSVREDECLKNRWRARALDAAEWSLTRLAKAALDKRWVQRHIQKVYVYRTALQ